MTGGPKTEHLNIMLVGHGLSAHYGMAACDQSQPILNTENRQSHNISFAYSFLLVFISTIVQLFELRGASLPFPVKLSVDYRCCPPFGLGLA